MDFEHLDLFSGLGGFAIAASHAGFRTVAFCESDPDASEAGKTSRSGERPDEPLIGGIVRTSWPTPQSRDEKGETQNKDRMDAVPNVLKASWPTLNASDGSGGPQNPEKRKEGNHSVQLPDYIGKMQYGCLARTESFVARLTTLSAWLMGYTAQYLALWETRSSRKSRQKSCAPCTKP